MFPQKGCLTGGVTLALLCACVTLCGAESLVLAERGKAAAVRGVSSPISAQS